MRVKTKVENSRTCASAAHPVLVLDQDMVETTDCHEKQDDLDIVKDVYPLLSLRSLSTNVKHLVCEVARLENGLADARGTKSCSENVLVVW